MGKPYGRLHGSHVPVAISISHASPFILAAATLADRTLLGVDIERVRDFAPSTWEAFLTLSEKEHVASAPRETQAYLRTLLWSLKEATLKALGTGLRMHPSRIDLSCIFKNEGRMPDSVEIEGVRRRAKIRFWRAGCTHVAAMIALPYPPEYTGRTCPGPLWNYATPLSISS